MNDWVAALLGAVGLLAAGAAALRWLATTLTQQMWVVGEEVATETEAAIVGPLVARLEAMETRMDRIEVRFDTMDAKIDHIAEVLDLRIRPLEADMALIKQHLLGTPAA